MLGYVGPLTGRFWSINVRDRRDRRGLNRVLHDRCDLHGCRGCRGCHDRSDDFHVLIRDLGGWSGGCRVLNRDLGGSSGDSRASSCDFGDCSDGRGVCLNDVLRRRCGRWSKSLCLCGLRRRMRLCSCLRRRLRLLLLSILFSLFWFVESIGSISCGSDRLRKEDGRSAPVIQF